MSDSALLFHKSVLVREVLTYLDPQPGKVYIDATLGSGGHTRALLTACPDVRVIGLDWDKISLDTYGNVLHKEFGDRITCVWSNFAHLYKVVKKLGIATVDGVLADFGTSQMQIHERPGFSVYRTTDLDMRMAPGHQKITAYDILNGSTAQDMADIFWRYGQERYAYKIAHAIVEDRRRKKFTTTTQLAKLIERLVPKNPRTKIHQATKVFQALRIYINNELDNITAFLPAIPSVLNVGGRLVCISFHSLEDSIVKNFLYDQQDNNSMNILTRRAIIASEEEIKENASARSAKLRAAIKI